MKRVVIDTNVVISAALVRIGKPAKIIELISENKLDMIYNNDILQEYKEVLAKERLGFSPDAQHAAINMIVRKGTIVEANISTIPLTDESDRVLYDTAKTGGKEWLLL